MSGSTDLRPEQLPASDRTPEPWANGQGLTYPITGDRASAAAAGPAWRVNLAEIPGACEFSVIPGTDRSFLLLDDVPLTLDLPATTPVRHLQVIEFAGESAPRCWAAAPARALNLLRKQGQVNATLQVVVLDGPTDWPVQPGGCLVVVKIDGRPEWAGRDDLRPGDAVRLDVPSTAPPQQLQLGGVGRVAVITIAPHLA